ncbi:hypothetical protein [Olleya sp. R77988]|uniref:hypothetical protein n=1 Tax=Olleya sp. R77988 TaxID=3093875 RepID=UPI0037CC16BB
MKATFSDRKNFAIYSIKKHLGLIGIGFAFIVFGSIFMLIGYKTNDGLGFIIFGGAFIVISLCFMLYMLPSSFMHYYEQAEIKKYGSFTTAKIINKRVDDYSHNTSSFDSGGSKHIEEFLYVIEFEFTYNNQSYQSECFFEQKSTFEAITLDTELPIKFLKTKPRHVTLRRRKLSNQIGIPEKMCR